VQDGAQIADVARVEGGAVTTPEWMAAVLEWTLLAACLCVFGWRVFLSRCAPRGACRARRGGRAGTDVS
jgi:hypothetical protein